MRPCAAPSGLKFATRLETQVGAMGCNIARLQRILFHPSYPSVGEACFVMPWVRTLHHTAGYFANQSIGSQRNAAPFGIPIALLIDSVTTERAPPMDGMIREARTPNSTILSPIPFRSVQSVVKRIERRRHRLPSFPSAEAFSCRFLGGLTHENPLRDSRG